MADTDTRALGLAAGFAALLLIGAVVVTLRSPGDDTGAVAGSEVASTLPTQLTPGDTATADAVSAGALDGTGETSAVSRDTDPPGVTGLRADRCEVSARVAGAERVTLYWRQGGRTHQDVMTPVPPERYIAEIGPPEAEPGIVWWVVATDAAGNTTRSADQRLAVGCPSRR